jgi:hypothetical protein
MNRPPTWNDVEREHIELQFVLPMGAARCLRSALPRLLQTLDELGARNPEDRQYRREAYAALEALGAALETSLRPLDAPRATPQDGT